MESKIKIFLDESDKIDLKDVKVEDIREGEGNLNYILKSKNGKYVLRLSKEISENRLNNEFEILNFLKSEEIDEVPTPILYNEEFEAGEILIESYVGEEDLNKKNFEASDLILLAELVAEIHSIPLSQYNEFFDKENKKEVSLREVYRKDFEKWSKRPYQEYLDLVEEPRNRIKRMYKKQKKLLEKIPDLDISQSLVHGDIGSNCRRGEDKTYLIDWEFSRIGYPENEILYFFIHEDLSHEQRNIFLEEYQKHRELEEDFEKTRKFYDKFLTFNDMIWAAKRVEKGEDKHRDLLEERLEHLEKLHQQE